MGTRPLLLAASLGALISTSIQFAWTNTAQEQQVADTLRAAYILLRVGAVWLALSGARWKRLGFVTGAFAAGVASAYCTYAILHSWWGSNPISALYLWLPQPSLPHFRKHPLHMFFLHNTIEQVVTQLIQPLPNSAVLLVSCYLALMNSYWIWVRDQYTSSLTYIAVSAIVGTVATPWALVTVGLALLTRKQQSHVHAHSRLSGHVGATSKDLASQIPDKQQAGKQGISKQAADGSLVGEQQAGCSLVREQLPDKQQNGAQGPDKQQNGAGDVQPASASSSATQPTSKEQAWLQKISGYHYQRKLRQTQVTLKIFTEHGPSQLPVNMAQQLQACLASSGHRILDIAARPGCITISIDLMLDATHQSVGMAEGCDLSAVIPAEQQDSCTAAHVANGLLHLLQPMLADELADGPTKPVAMVQSGDITLAAHWDAAAATWQLQPQPPALETESTIGLFLGVARQLPHNRVTDMPGQVQEAETWLRTDSPSGSHSSVKPDLRSDLRSDLEGLSRGTIGSIESMGTGSTSLPSSTAAAADGLPLIAPSIPSASTVLTTAKSGLEAPCGASPTEHVHIVTVTAQLLAEQSRFAHYVEWPTISGWEAPSTGAHEDTAADAVKLLARCRGVYVMTHVLQVSDSVPGSAHAAVQLELHVPDSLLPRHHAGGPPVGLLPVTLELWQGPLHRISSTPLLLQLSELQSRGSCWWWGASSSVVQRAVQDVQQTNEALQISLQAVPSEQAGLLIQAIKTWTAFCTDLNYWLLQLQRVATESGNCTIPAATHPTVPSMLHQPSLTAHQLSDMGDQLKHLCKELHLHGLLCMLEEQQKVVHAWCHSTPTPRLPPSAYIPSNDGMKGEPQFAQEPVVAERGNITMAEGTSMGLQCSHVDETANNGAAYSRGGTMVTTAVQPSQLPVPLLQQVLRCARAVVVGLPCAQCEGLMRSQLARLLAGIQVVPSCLFTLAYVLGASRGLVHKDWYGPLLTLACGLPHSAVVFLWLLRTRARRHTAAPHDSASAAELTTRLTCAAYWARMGSMAMFGWGSMPLNARLQEEVVSGMFLMSTVIIALGEQVSSMLLLPPLLALAATLLESLHIMAMMHRVGTLTPLTALVTLVAITLPRVLMETYLRLASMQRATASRAVTLAVGQPTRATPQASSAPAKVEPTKAKHE